VDIGCSLGVPSGNGARDMAVVLDRLRFYDCSCGTERQTILIREETVKIDHTLMALYLIHINQK
jgi:hypothetical protein